jgi:cation transport regulator
MPYTTNNNLPELVRDGLPEHAQDIYRAAFNNAYTGFAGQAERERRAHMVAWAAVKRTYYKRGDRWFERMAAAS